MLIKNIYVGAVISMIHIIQHKHIIYSCRLDEETNGKERQSARSLRHESHCHPKIVVSLF